MTNKAYKRENALVPSQFDLGNIVAEVIRTYLINKDLTMSDAELESTLDRIKEDVTFLLNKPDKDKIYPYTNPFIVKVPKNNEKPIDITFEGQDEFNNYIGFSMKVPLSFFDNPNNKPHITWANDYAMKNIGKFKYLLDTTSSPNNNLISISVPNAVKGNITVSCLNDEVKIYDPNEDTVTVNLPAPDTEMNIEPDSNFPIIPDLDKLVRSESIKWVESVKLSDYILMEIAKLTREDTLYAVREDDKTDNLEFTFTSKEDARARIPDLYNRLASKRLWKYVTLNFTDNVTEIDSLFEGMDHSNTVRAIKGANITSAKKLYKDTKIHNISPELIQGMSLLENLDEAFAGSPNLTRVPTHDALFGRNTSVASAKKLYADCVNLKDDPEYWRNPIPGSKGKRWTDFSGYLTTDVDKIKAPFPWQQPNHNIAYPNGEDPYYLVFDNVEQFKAYYPEYFNNYLSDTDDIRDLSKLVIEIQHGNLDTMFKNSNITKLPKTIIAPEATSAREFAMHVHDLVNTEYLPGIFLRCSKLTDVSYAFNACYGLTEGFELIGASDTIDNYTKIFKDCNNIDAMTLPTPWRWKGLEGYPDDIIGIEGYQNIPDLPSYVPKEWGGTADDDVKITNRSTTPVILNCYVDEDTFDVDFRGKNTFGDIVEIAMVDPNDKNIVLGEVKKYYMHGTEVNMSFGIKEITHDGHSVLRNTDCVRIRFREMNRTQTKVFSDYVYQVPMIRTTALTNDTIAKPLAFKTKGDD